MAKWSQTDKWSIDLEKYAEVTKRRIQEVRSELIFQLYANIIKRTPVDTGRARGNWVVTIGSPSEEVDEKKLEPRYSSPNDMPNIEGDDSAFITNNLPYINALEYGWYPEEPKRGSWVKGKNGEKGHWEIKSKDGFSKEAAQGMVGVTAAEMSRIYEETINRVYQ